MKLAEQCNLSHIDLLVLYITIVINFAIWVLARFKVMPGTIYAVQSSKIYYVSQGGQRVTLQDVWVREIFFHSLFNPAPIRTRIEVRLHLGGGGAGGMVGMGLVRPLGLSGGAALREAAQVLGL